MKWEDMCTNCGLCCREKVKSRHYLIILDESCPFRDEQNMMCTVYPSRFRLCARCRKVNIFRACFSTYLPSICAYVRWAEKHHIRFARKRELVFSSSVDDETSFH